MKLTRGMSFDIVLPLMEEIKGLWQKYYIAIDVYTRFPVTLEIMRGFFNKTHYGKRGFGLVFTRQCLPRYNRSYFLARARSTSLMALEELGINYCMIKREIARMITTRTNGNAMSHNRHFDWYVAGMRISG